MINLEEIEIPKEMTPDHMLGIMLVILKTHYERESDKLKDILDGFYLLDHKKLCEMWERLANEGTLTKKEALSYFTEWLVATLDGGNLTLPPSNS